MKLDSQNGGGCHVRMYFLVIGFVLFVVSEKKKKKENDTKSNIEILTKNFEIHHSLKFFETLVDIFETVLHLGSKLKFQ